ncbi:hypothetical protein CERZMDRAFT_91438 [Cercospora zeae-maydis SCOH1-5]|uniref:Uncharacterized protein n=1 Tax=Cercospora zeae-maydis SCOH1-5 TaxID=717836 RepID=A0A6A6F6W8_9PEZI|nr:hypothetical protein CERZMDRAFT_91438 [Cercospora zeae-maydis SCOH1-5]
MTKHLEPPTTLSHPFNRISGGAQALSLSPHHSQAIHQCKPSAHVKTHTHSTKHSSSPNKVTNSQTPKLASYSLQPTVPYRTAHASYST